MAEQSKERRILEGLLALLLLLASLFVLFKIIPFLKSIWLFVQAIVGPFVIALIISYLLNPIVNLLHERGLPRWIAVLLIYILFLCSLVILLMNLLPLIDTQFHELIEHLPKWNQQFQSMMQAYTYHSKTMLPESMQQAIEHSLQNVERGISTWVTGIVNSIGETINHLFLAFVVPFLAFYMMRDSKELEKGLLNLFPSKNRKELVRLIRDIDYALGNYIRGQLLVSLVVGICVYIGYWLIGLPYALILAGTVALFNIIPYLGPFLGAVPALFVALTISKKMFVATIVINFLVQILEGNVISPQIVGRTLHMHPLTIIFVLLVGGEIGGVWGLILAVPLFAVIKVILQHLLAHSVRIRV